MFWPLMKDCITSDDRKAMVDFVKTTQRFTNGPKVREFENLWSQWLGVDYSIFVSSGSTANLLLVAATIEKYNLQKGDKVLLPAMTWVTNISPIIQLGLKPIFCDIDPTHFSFDEKHMSFLAKKHEDIKLVFVSHLFGFSAPIEKYQQLLPNAIFIEDVCESYGATAEYGKVGTFSLGSTFSFYFGHHMTTVEGGFVSTNDRDLYELMRAKRSHGLAREMSQELFEKHKKMHPHVHEQFLFITDGYNLRNVEINAVLGISQLPRLNSNNKIRISNLNRFLIICNEYDCFFTDYKLEGNCSFCLPFILDDVKMKNSLEIHLMNNGIETRPLCGGNLLKQPFLKDYELDITWGSNVEKLHNHSFFIGNNHLITDEDFEKLEQILSQFMENY